MEDRRNVFESDIRSIKESKLLLDENKKILLEFIKFKESQGIVISRLCRIAEGLRAVLSNLDKPLSKVNDKDIQSLLIYINSNSKWRDWTKATYTMILKNFIRWLNKTYKTTVSLDDIKPIKPKNSLLPEYLITSDEFSKIIEQSPTASIKLTTELLYETGARVSEILDLKVQNIEFNTYGAKLYVKGKTGQRVIPIVWYANELKQFIATHPNKDKPDSPLFYIVLAGKVLPLEYPNYRKALRKMCRLAGINKRIHPHLFRHTRMTELAKRLPEQTLKALAGWSAGSDMAQVYIHLSQRDVEDSLLQKVYGIKTDEKEDHNSVKVCPRCKEPNPYFVKVCQRCGAPLDEKELIEAEMNNSPEKLKEIDSMANILLSMLKSNPEMIETFRKSLSK